MTNESKSRITFHQHLMRNFCSDNFFEAFFLEHSFVHTGKVTGAIVQPEWQYIDKWKQATRSCDKKPCQKWDCGFESCHIQIFIFNKTDYNKKMELKVFDHAGWSNKPQMHVKNYFNANEYKIRTHDLQIMSLICL